MKTINSIAALIVSAAITGSALAQSYTIDQPAGAATFGAQSTGQTFTPNVGVNPSLAGVATVPLTAITFYHGNYTSAMPSATTYIKIYDGDPNGSGSFIGASTNAIDTTGGSFHDQFDWNFGGLSLNTGTEYWAVMSSTNSSTSIDVAEVSLESSGNDAYAGGSGLIANIAPHPMGNDARFQVVMGSPLAFEISQGQGNATFGARSTGQTFTPGIGVSPASTWPVFMLTEVEFYHGNYASAIPSTTTWLKIYDGDPNASGTTLVGMSTNAVDTTGLSFHTLLHWDFPQLPLLGTIEYWAVMSTSNSSTSIDVAEVSLESAGSDPYAGGAGLIANIVPHPQGNDAKFTARFFNGILGAFAVSGTGCPSSAGLATLASQVVPRIGQTFTADFGNLSTTGLPYAVIGFSDLNWGGLPLPLPLASLIPGADPSCMVMVSADASQPLLRQGSSATFSLAIPNLATLPGLVLHLQGAQFEPTGFSLTPKGSMVVGN